MRSAILGERTSCECQTFYSVLTCNNYAYIDYCNRLFFYEKRHTSSRPQFRPLVPLLSQRAANGPGVLGPTRAAGPWGGTVPSGGTEPGSVLRPGRCAVGQQCGQGWRSEEHTSELQSQSNLSCP